MSAHVLPSARPGIRSLAVVLVAMLGALLAIVLWAQPAHAASRVDVSPAPNADGSTTVTLTGSGFQYLPNAPGGVYVFFGAVSDPATNAWAPSQGGQSGSTFSYANTTGSVLLIAFAGGSSASESNATIDASGTWSAQMTIPGSTFTSSHGNPHAGEAQTGATIDCLQVQCGIITIGAHGNVNANNESFTPVGFQTAGGQIQSGTGGQSFTDEATVVEIPSEESEETAEAPADAGDATASPAQPAEPDAEADARDAGSGTTVLVLAVLGVAVLALIAAIATVLIRRARERKAGAAGDGPLEEPPLQQEETAGTAESAEQTPQSEEPQ